MERAYNLKGDRGSLQSMEGVIICKHDMVALNQMLCHMNNFFLIFQLYLNHSLEYYFMTVKIN